MSYISTRTATDLLITFSDAVVLAFRKFTGRINILEAKAVVEDVRKQFKIETRREGRNVDFITLDYPQSRSLVASKDSTFCFHIIYMVTKNADQCEGRGPMVPHAFFFDMYEALDYMYDLPGVQGRRANWAEERFGDYRIEIQIVHDTAMSAHTVNEVAHELERAQAKLKTAMETYQTKYDVLAKHQFDTSDLPKPKLEDFIGETKRNFICR